MKINNPRQKKSKKLFLPLLVVAILLASWLVFASIKGMWPFEAESQNNAPADQTMTTEEQEAIEANDAQEKQEFLDNQQKDDDDTDSSSNTESGNKNNEPAINLSARTQDNLLVVTTNLSTVTSGECILTLQKGQKIVTKTANVIFAPNASTCEGFSINQSELGSGTWRITLSVQTDGNTVSRSINHTL